MAKEYDLLLALIKAEKPDAIVHFAEQRAAPYSQKNSKTKRYTVDNNVGGTNNLLAAVVDSELDIHVVHLGTMGVYGYGNSGGQIPEGYMPITLPNGDKKEILHPAYPGSVYHTTKCLDALLFQFYNKNDQIRVTDLHQGIVWGTNTPQTVRDERLINRFDYDGDYGTVLNRFLMQSAMGVPLTIYGTGGQTRGFIHIRDTCRCLLLGILLLCLRCAAALLVLWFAQLRLQQAVDLNYSFSILVWQHLLMALGNTKRRAPGTRITTL